ncbi:MAG: SpoIIE family protein phosphatase [Flavobacteriales bacterium]|nr:SpoIIE family protein phosphatase [Flavobacteriales bacterium]MCB9203754.1 SpoIIE family protein phosphatase [Flavobacteriales bacterium]
MPSTLSTPIKPASGILSWIQDAWASVSSLGVGADDTSYFSRKVVLTNQVAVIIFIVGLIQTGGFLAIGSPQATINWFLLLLVVVWSVPFLNFLENRVASRYVLSLALPLFSVIFVGHIRALHPESVHDASFYVPRYFQIALSFIPVILFGFEEKKHLFISFTLNVLVLLFYNEIMGLMGAGLGVAEPMIKDPFFVSVSSVFGLAVVSTGYFFLNKMNSEYEVQIEGLLEKTEQQNRSMQDAINYAKNIQQVVLPKDNVLAKLEDRLFVMYKPLHTVSGDFYMVEESNDHIVFAVIDCTGHGVPGAFMSILASSALQRSIDLVGFDRPEVILNNANRLFHEDLSRSGNPEIQDGMDMVLCSFDKNKNVLHAAGANLMIHVVDGGSIAEYRTDKGGISIGKPERTFKPLSIPLNSGAQVYISSDGYYDQFGGERNKRIGRARYRQLLEETAKLPVKEQHEKLVAFFDDWKGDQFQIDDVCVIGFRC